MPTPEERLAALESAHDAEVTDEVLDDKKEELVAETVVKLQSQFIWMLAAAVLFGAAIGYVLERAFA